MEQTRTTLKGYFQTGDFPTQQNFEDLIDSSPNQIDDGEHITFLIQHDYTEFAVASPSGDFTSATLPNGFFPVYAYHRTTQDWLTSGAITGINMALVDTDTSEEYLISGQADIFDFSSSIPMTANNNFWTYSKLDASVNHFYDNDPITFNVRVIADDNLDTLTSGKIDIYLVAQKLATVPTQIWP